MRPISSTTPAVDSRVTESPRRTGCVNAISRPATKFPSVRCEAKPTMIPTTGDGAHLRDDEQGREDADKENQGRDTAPQHAIAGHRFGRQLPPGDSAIDQA